MDKAEILRRIGQGGVEELLCEGCKTDMQTAEDNLARLRTAAAKKGFRLGI